MILYIVSVQIHDSTHDDWLAYMRHTHIPDVLATGCFTKCLLCKVLQPENDGQTIAYCIQYFCPSLADYDRYRTDFAPALQQDHTHRFPAKFTASRQVLEILNLQA
jgi:hypothetical protein